MGHTYEGARYMRWLVARCKTANGHTRVVYGVSGNSSLKERTLDHLKGYRNSRPVRVGNGASLHPQLDVYGEVILGIDTLYRNGGGLSEEALSLVVQFADTVASKWRGCDRSVWEVRGAKQHFVYSKLMC